VRHVDPDGVHELRVPTVEQTSLRLFVKQRARYVVEAGKAKRRIGAWLVLANPRLAEALDDVSSAVATAFLRRHVDPFGVREQGKASRPAAPRAASGRILPVRSRFGRRQGERGGHSLSGGIRLGTAL